jgi:hypothetical protein
MATTRDSGAAAKRKAKTAAAVLTKSKKAKAAAESVIDCSGSEDGQDEECKKPPPSVRGEQGTSSGVTRMCGGIMRPKGREMRELENEARETAPASAAPGIQAAPRPEQGTARTDLVTVVTNKSRFGNADTSTITTRVPRKAEVKMTMIPSGYHQTDREIEESIRYFVNNTLIKKVKFISHEGMMDYGTSISKFVLKGLKVQEETQRELFWSNHKARVSKIINRKRNNIGNCIAKAYKGE